MPASRSLGSQRRAAGDASSVGRRGRDPPPIRPAARPVARRPRRSQAPRPKASEPRAPPAAVASPRSRSGSPPPPVAALAEPGRRAQREASRMSNPGREGGRLLHVTRPRDLARGADRAPIPASACRSGGSGIAARGERGNRPASAAPVGQGHARRAGARSWPPRPAGPAVPTLWPRRLRPARPDERRVRAAGRIGRRVTAAAAHAARGPGCGGADEAELRDAGMGAAARGLICHVAAGEGADGLDRAVQAVALAPGCAACRLASRSRAVAGGARSPGVGGQGCGDSRPSCLVTDRWPGWRSATCARVDWQYGWRCTRSAGPPGGGPSPACGSAARFRLGCGAGQRTLMGGDVPRSERRRNRRGRSEPRLARRCPR